jgi:hypothetical protein
MRQAGIGRSLTAERYGARFAQNGFIGGIA